MFKNFKWKDILLAILTAAVGWLGGTEVYTSYNTDDSGKLIRTPDLDNPVPVDPQLYTITASFYEVDNIEVGNFKDVTVEDDIGVYTVYVAKPTPNYIEAAFKSDYESYPNAKLRNIEEIIKPKSGDETEEVQLE